MKKLFGILALSAFLISPSVMAYEGIYGIIYKNTYEAGVGFTNVSPAKKGEATCRSFFALVGLGKCGINDAAKAGNIKTVAYYDTHIRNILGYKTMTTTVYGQ